MQAHRDHGAVADESRCAVERPAVQGGPEVQSAAQRLIADRRMDDAELWTAVLEKPDGNRPLVAAAHEIEGPVDRIDDPDAATLARDGAALLAEHAVGRKQPGQDRKSVV